MVKWLKIGLVSNWLWVNVCLVILMVEGLSVSVFVFVFGSRFIVMGMLVFSVVIEVVVLRYGCFIVMLLIVKLFSFVVSVVSCVVGIE